MAWTTSACLRARLPFVAVAEQLPKRMQQVQDALRRSASRTRPVLFLSLSALCLGFAAPLLPTSMITAALIVTGIAIAVVGTGANLAGIVSSSQASSGPAIAPKASHHAPIQIGSAPVVPASRIRGQHPKPMAPHDWAELMSRINHELRTPLNAVIGFSEVMSLEMFGPLGSDRYRDYVRHINDSAADLLKSAEDTLALTALFTHPRPTGLVGAATLDHAFADAWKIVERKAAARNIGVKLKVSKDIEVLSEPRALRQILINMLSEAVHRSAPGGNVTALAVTDGELIEIVVSVNAPAPGMAPRAGSLAICLARTLLQMQGTSLLEIETPSSGWSAVTVLDRAVQPDFFTERVATTSRHRETVAAY
jgi:hypothetical protein